jgi:hypothetical protein
LLDGQVLVVTHSVHLMGLSGGVRYTEVRRPAAETLVISVQHEQFEALDAISDELGLTRGELLTLRRVFAFVEGAVDRLVFEELFGRRLRDAGVELMAMHGTSKMQAIIESDLLFKYYRQKMAVIVDNIVADQLPNARDLEALEQITKGRGRQTQELPKAAELLKNAFHAGREVALNAIATPDIIAELDADVLREVQGADYPGFERSEAAWRNSRTVSWKAFCAHRGWLRAEPDDVRPVVEEMRRRGSFPPELVRIVEWLEHLGADVPPG